ncbi:hypothetical protein DB88DRAFT_473397 [Papiliotrema laurentii]|uniref:Uncharacterized protein n=1 Tax=Papiliotrema laurentii TaxID=5418 RepID=A0AAD9CXI1_PAPLA|nr:hypothetical protein DB88DRAFT_473397 [Papiliotrema laurentii]
MSILKRELFAPIVYPSSNPSLHAGANRTNPIHRRHDEEHTGGVISTGTGACSPGNDKIKRVWPVLHRSRVCVDTFEVSGISRSSSKYFKTEIISGVAFDIQPEAYTAIGSLFQPCDDDRWRPHGRAAYGNVRSLDSTHSGYNIRKPSDDRAGCMWLVAFLCELGILTAVASAPYPTPQTLDSFVHINRYTPEPLSLSSELLASTNRSILVGTEQQSEKRWNGSNRPNGQTPSGHICISRPA